MHLAAFSVSVLSTKSVIAVVVEIYYALRRDPSVCRSSIIIIIIIHEYYYGGAVALLLQDHLTMSVSRR